MAIEPPALMEESDLDDLKGQNSHSKVRHGTCSEPTSELQFYLNSRKKRKGEHDASRKHDLRPGHKALQCILYLAYPTAMLLVNSTTVPLDAQYAAKDQTDVSVRIQEARPALPPLTFWPTKPIILAVLMIQPL